jgi:short-subunit dehydrogenase
MLWDGSVVMITGASRGIGRAVAQAAAARGATLALLARSKEELDRVLAEAGGRGAVAAADIGDRAQTEAAIDALVREVGVPDILVNNAGIGVYGYVADTPVEDFERLMRVNYLGTVYATKAVLPAMIQRGSGHIVSIASIAARIGAPLEGAYSASKFAMAGLTEALSLELANKGIGVSMINPGPVETTFFDARGVPYARARPKPVPAEKVAQAVIAAVEHGRGEVMIPRWLKFPAALKVLMPRMFRMGTLRDFRKDLR